MQTGRSSPTLRRPFSPSVPGEVLIPFKIRFNEQQEQVESAHEKMAAERKGGI